MMILKLLFIISTLQLINCQSFMELGPEYGFQPPVPPVPIENPMYRNTKNTHFRRDSTTDQQYATLKKFYELDLLKNYSLNVTDWDYIWFEFEEMSVKNQTQLIKDLRSKQKTIEMILIQLCKDRCLRDFCEMPINAQTNAILPRNNESWLRFSNLQWEEIPLKIKKLIILQLKIDRFRTANSLTMMVNELCPYNKYFDETSNNRQTGSQNNENGNSNSKIQVNDNPTSNNLDKKQIEAN